MNRNIPIHFEKDDKTYSFQIFFNFWYITNVNTCIIYSLSVFFLGGGCFLVFFFNFFALHFFYFSNNYKQSLYPIVNYKWKNAGACFGEYQIAKIGIYRYLGKTDDKLSPRYRDEMRIVFYSMCHKIFIIPNLSVVNCYTIKWSDIISWLNMH